MFNRLITLFFLCGLMTGCSGGGSKSGSDSDNPPEDEVITLMLFEGSTSVIKSNLSVTDVEWTQLSGQPITLGGLTETDLTVTMPWLIDGPASAAIQATATVDGEQVNKQFVITILDRRYLAMRVQNDDNNVSDLFIDYISSNDEEGVPQAGMIKLTDLASGEYICSYSISPSGQYIAYTIDTTGHQFMPVCRGVYIVNIDNQITQKLSKLDSNSQETRANALRWSPDGLKIAYSGDHGDGSRQIYNIDVVEATTTYINHDDNSLAGAQWPVSNLYTIDDGGNPFISGPISDHLGIEITWLNNSRGLAFQVTDSISLDNHPYLASVYGDARKLNRSMFIFEYIFELDEEAQDEYWGNISNCPPEGICAVVMPGPSFLTPIHRDYINPRKMESSIDGHLMVLSRMKTNVGNSYDVFSVSKPVVDGEDVPAATPIDGIDVYDVAWSPTAVDLAFAGGGNLRHSHTDDPTVTLGQLTGSEIPNQLYLYQNYQQLHTEPQERLAYPQPSIDDSPVRELKWSIDGDYIAYVRGETHEGNYFYTLWVSLVDDVRDESRATIDANTTLLVNLAGSSSYMTDFIWSPDGSGLLALMQTIGEEPRFRYVTRTGTESFDSPPLLGPNPQILDSFAPTFSPDGQYYAYVDEESTADGDVPALFIQATDGSSRLKVNGELQPGESIKQQITWSPHGDAVVYSVNSSGGSRHYLVNVDGLNQNLAEFLEPDERITRVIVK